MWSNDALLQLRSSVKYFISEWIHLEIPDLLIVSYMYFFHQPEIHFVNERGEKQTHLPLTGSSESYFSQEITFCMYSISESTQTCH